MLSLDIKTRESGDIVIVDLIGRATIGPSTEHLSNTLRKLLEGGARKVIVNLAKTQQVDSSGISIIVRTFVTLGRESGILKLCAATGRVREVLTVTRLLDAIPSFDDEAAALASFK